jgi:hypothetical protein
MVDETKTKCFAGTYIFSVLLHGGLVCYGGFGQPTCKYFEKCLEQFKGDMTKRRYNNILKKYGKN